MRHFIQSLSALIVGLTLAARPVMAAATLPTREWTMLRQVAAEYGLSSEETWLLAAIRIHENGRPGLEFGIGGPMDSGHKAHRYQDGIRSFRVQCAWAAGTIRKRYAGNLQAFGRRYNPYHATAWARNVAAIIVRLKRLHNGILP